MKVILKKSLNTSIGKPSDMRDFVTRRLDELKEELELLLECNSKQKINIEFTISNVDQSEATEMGMKIANSDGWVELVQCYDIDNKYSHTTASNLTGGYEFRLIPTTE